MEDKMPKLQINTVGKGEVCICPECKWIYVSDTPFACENTECSRYGKEGQMAYVVVLPKKQKEALSLMIESEALGTVEQAVVVAMYEWLKKQDMFSVVDEVRKKKNATQKKKR